MLLNTPVLLWSRSPTITSDKRDQSGCASPSHSKSRCEVDSALPQMPQPGFPPPPPPACWAQSSFWLVQQTRLSILNPVSSVFELSLNLNKLLLYGNCSSQPPHLTDERPQWLSGPSLVLPTAESPPETKPGQTVFYAQQFLFNYWHRLTKNA